MTRLSILDQSPIRPDATPAEALQDTLRLAEAADRLGYHRYWLAEHHSSNGLAGAAPEIMVGQIAARTRSIRVGTGGVMLSHYSPLKVAETFRVLEALHPGRIDLGIGRAPGSDMLTDQALAVGPGALDHQRFPAQVHDLIGWLAGALPADHPFARVRAMPIGPSVPELWLLGSSDQSAQIAAYFGCPFSFAHFISGADAGPQVMQLYRTHYRPSARWPEPVGSIGVFALAADTAEQADRLMRSRDLWSLRQRRGLTAPVPTVEEAEAFPYTEQDRALVAGNRRRCVWGTADRVRDGLLALGESYGVDEFVVLTICPTFEARLRSYELLATAFALAPRDGAAAPAKERSAVAG
jgi:luciferase family oxidoreductase group 1